MNVMKSHSDGDGVTSRILYRQKAKLPMYPPELNKVHITTGAKLEMTFAPLRKNA